MRCENCHHFVGNCTCSKGKEKMKWNKTNLPPEESVLMCFWKSPEDGVYEMQACFYSEGKFINLDIFKDNQPFRIPDYWRLIEDGELPE